MPRMDDVTRFGAPTPRLLLAVAAVSLLMVTAALAEDRDAARRAEWAALTAWLQTRSCDQAPATPRVAAFIASFCNLRNIAK